MAFSRSATAGAVALLSISACSTLQAQTNSQVSLIVDMRGASYSQDPANYSLPGFQLGGEAGLTDEGFSLGHTELAIAGNIGEFLEGKFAGVIHHHVDEVETEMEEFWLQTVGLGNGLTIKAGRFFSDIGYINNKHPHAWDFVDEPLVYRGLLGMQYKDDGIQASWIAPTDLYWRTGVEAFKGKQFPFNSSRHDKLDTFTFFTEIGGDIDESQSWQLGLSYMQGDSVLRTGGHGHHHEHEEEEDHHDAEPYEEEGEEEHMPAFSGKSRLAAVDFVYKWAPGGNPKNRSFVLQMEYFDRRETGRIDMLHDGKIEETTPFTSRQRGAYIQSVYKFHPHWKVGLRYDRLFSKSTGDMEILTEAGLVSGGHRPHRTSAMVAWVPNEYTTLRLQYNRDNSRPVTDHQWLLQFVYSFGPHGAHQF